MATLLHFANGLFMSHTKPRGAEPLRVIPRVAPTRREAHDADNTSVDVRPAPAPRARRESMPQAPARLPKASTPPPNVIPFTKPRAISELAAANPRVVAMSGQHGADPLAHLRPPLHAPQLPSPVMHAAPSPARAPAIAVATGYGSSGGAATARALPQPVQAQPQPVQAQPRPVQAQPQLVQAQPQLVQAQPQPMWPASASAPPAPAAHAPMLAQPATTWAVFEKLGLGAPKIDAQQASKWLVSAYRLLGFSILTIIVVVLVGYITTTAFFYVSSSWVVPMAITASDEKVMSLQAQLSTQQDQRDRIANDLNQAERAIVAQQQFQAEFGKAIKGDLAGRRAALARMRGLASTAAGTRAAIQNQNSAYAGAARKRMKQEYAAGLIDRNAMLSGKFQLAQISSSNLSLAERQAEFETRAAELEATTRSLDAILAGAEDSGDLGLSYEVLQIKQQYEASRLELAKAVEMRDSLKASLARQDKILAALQGSAYLRAINDKATVAFVPYGNLSSVKKGDALYACRLTMVFCYRVGVIVEIVPGEVAGRHPHRDKNLRGQLIEIKLDKSEAEAGMEEHLFAGGKPFIL